MDQEAVQVSELRGKRQMGLGAIETTSNCLAILYTELSVGAVN